MIPIHDENPITVKPLITWALMAICVVVFVWQVFGTDAGLMESVFALGVIPAVLFNTVTLAPNLVWLPAELTVITSMFLHGGWAHLGGNLLYLWVFGNNVEVAMGRTRFVVFYFVCGIVAVFAQVLPDMHSNVPMVGASGAISGVLGAYILLYPMVQVHVIIPIFFYPLRIRVSALIVLAFWFGMQLFSSIMDSGQGGVAFGAHIGGFVAGLVFVGLFKRKAVPLLIPFRDYLPFAGTNR